MRNPVLHAVTSAVLMMGCTGSGQLNYSAEVTTPDLVYIDSDVQVVANYDEPIFYRDSWYWRYQGGAWYRSQRYNGGFVRIEVAPIEIRRIERPAAYIHYRGSARANAEHGNAKDMRREERQERKEERQERKEDRKDDRNDRKDDRKDHRDDRNDHKHGH